MRQLSVSNYFNGLVIALFVIISAPLLFADGMFMDGTQYAVVSKNLANGVSTFWLPFLSSSWEKQGVNRWEEKSRESLWMN